MIESTSFTAVLIPQGTWALTNSNDGFAKPCQAFLCASTARSAWVVQTTPLHDNWGRWERTADVYWVDVMSKEELSALR